MKTFALRVTIKTKYFIWQQKHNAKKFVSGTIFFIHNPNGSGLENKNICEQQNFMYIFLLPLALSIEKNTQNLFFSFKQLNE